MQAALRESAGLCLPHLRRALERLRDEASFDFLVEVSTEKLRALEAGLDEFIRKNDYRFAGEGFGPEATSWREVIAMMVGERVRRQ